VAHILLRGLSRFSALRKICHVLRTPGTDNRDEGMFGYIRERIGLQGFLYEFFEAEIDAKNRIFLFI
jgi:hypothetical protein